MSGATPPLPPALPGEQLEFADAATGRVAWYRAGPASGAPLLLVHSVNAAASAYEVRPLYEHYRATRPVYALDLPGYGLSERSDRPYSPRLMTDAVRALVARIRAAHPGQPVDALALSLGAEFLARAAVEEPDAFRTLAFVSPTGFNGAQLRLGPAGATLGKPAVLGVLARPAWGRGLFELLTGPRVIRYFLRRTWGSRQIDAGLWGYDCAVVTPPGAEHAPLRFLSGFLFSADSGRLYEALGVPVWVAHGVRGDFVNYRALAALAGRPNWRVEVLDTGALPHFEAPDDFVRRYDRFLAAPPGR